VDKLVKALLAVLKEMEDGTAKASAADVIRELKKARYA
jgi:hypothetical protein